MKTTPIDVGDNIFISYKAVTREYHEDNERKTMTCLKCWMTLNRSNESKCKFSEIEL